MKNDAGFTLIETLIATVLFAVVSAAGVAVLSNYSRGQELVRDADSLSAELYMFHARLKEDLLLLLPRTVRGPYGSVEPPFLSSDGKDEPFVQVVKSGLMQDIDNVYHQGVELVDYVLEDDKIVRRRYHRADRVPDTGFTSEPVLEGVEKLSVRFQSNKVWLDAWQPLAASPDNKPDLIELTVTLKDRGVLRTVYQLGGARG